MIETERLILREWGEEDIAPFAEINRDPAVMEFFLSPLSEEESLGFYRRIVGEFAECGFGLYAVQLRRSGEFIGYTGFHRFDFEAEFSPGVEIGWRLASGHWGHGYATEAARACIAYARDKRLLLRLHSFTSVLNLRSQRVMQKAGMEKAGHFLHPALPPGHRLSRHVLYTLDL